MPWFVFQDYFCRNYLDKEYDKAALSTSSFNLYTEYTMCNARMDKSQAEIKTARSNINNLGYADDTILVAESEEELKSLLMGSRNEGGDE